MPEARTIRIFLASSSELAEDRKEFETREDHRCQCGGEINGED